jgi:hypothetical protein
MPIVTLRAEVFALANSRSAQRAKESEAGKVERRLYDANYNLNSVKNRYHQAVTKYEELRQLLSQHGVEIDLLPSHLRYAFEEQPASDGQADDQEEREEDGDDGEEDLVSDEDARIAI